MEEPVDRRHVSMNTDSSTFIIRRARMSDRNRIRAMQTESMRVLSSRCYSREEIEAFLVYVGTMDDQLIEEGSYYVVEVGGRIVASGGWSRVRSNYVNGKESAADPATAKMRSVFVHPAWARHGFGRMLMQRAEAEAFAAGYDKAELNALLSGVPFYRSLGYDTVRPIALNLPEKLLFRGMTMRKNLKQAVAPKASGTLDRPDDSRCCGEAA